ncbi:hypothetical protein [Pseudodesulfovibrio sp. zrk46]|uniref:hypothetical protein n=1 Tax=Pseudodesulfovibrio sp. zrk46 TaxID=2725288 RepID=UPI0014495252|nr:hypothetical protein [Pseudodesulfovibrio sp. zrk46]QJB56203.1 hypothetical protein HFN16_07165 [Pseudodesulfovibrio sp. zrk46]
MAGYQADDMRLMGGVPGQQLFTYRSSELIADITVSGYFDQAVEDYNLDTGDIIIVCSGATKADAIDLLVATNTSGAVTVVNGS